MSIHTNSPFNTAGRKTEVSQTPKQTFSLSSLDLTMTVTVGQGIGQEKSLERMLEFMSDGEFQIGALETYSDTDTLQDACRTAITKLAKVPFTDRLICKRIMEEVNTIMRKQNINPPGGWVPVLKKLKAGGEIQLPVEQAPRKSIWEGESALSFYKELQPFEAELLSLVKVHGIPGSFAALLTMVDAVQNTSPEFIAIKNRIYEERGQYAAGFVEAKR